MLSKATLCSFTTLAVAAIVHAQSTFPATPLASKHFTYPSGIPEKVDTDTDLIRGQQLGYNICNSTTEGPQSLCQTMFVNALDDFCLWAPSTPNQDVGSAEGEMVAWCTKPGRGTRLIPPGALTGVQFIKTPSYVAVVGFVNQSQIDIDPADFGGEMDPHGADLRGNPLGGIVFSNNFGTNPNNNTFTQAIEWHNFMGSNTFCIKACDPADPNAPHYCEHIYDRIGCAYNVPNNAQNDTFLSCDGENQDFPGTYTTNGQVVTYTQPPESLGPIPPLPFTARVPATSNCRTFQSTDIFAVATTSSSASASQTASGSGSSSGTASRSGSGSSSAGSPQNTSGAVRVQVAVEVGIALLGVVFSVVFFA
ncbi:hypothetical protein BDQ17DRAFT_1305516 [Cyathus striatus]|nr:hypothetical protein BDQ17DRAFT_1305516 [Cyathus striatus]